MLRSDFLPQAMLILQVRGSTLKVKYLCHRYLTYRYLDATNIFVLEFSKHFQTFLRFGQIYAVGIGLKA